MTSYGYDTQYVRTGGTTVFTDRPTGGGTVTSTRVPASTSRENPALPSVYVLSDRVAMLPPRGNLPENQVSYAQYATDYTVDHDPTRAPNSSVDGLCTAGSAGRNTGLVCATTTHHSGGVTPTPATVTSRSTYDRFGQKTSATSGNGNTTSYGYFADSDLDLSGGTSAGGWLPRSPTRPARTIAFGYDRAGNVARSWDRNATAGTPVSVFPGTDEPTEQPLCRDGAQ